MDDRRGYFKAGAVPIGHWFSPAVICLYQTGHAEPQTYFILVKMGQTVKEVGIAQQVAAHDLAQAKEMSVNIVNDEEKAKCWMKLFKNKGYFPAAADQQVFNGA